MRYNKVFINSIGYELPNLVVTTRELEERISIVLKKLGIPVGYIEDVTGIKERRWWPAEHSLVDGASIAGNKALETAAISGSDLDAVIYTGVCREYFEPATACHIAANLGVSERAIVYDISNACLGVLNGIIDLANRIELGQIKCGLVVSCESARQINEDVISGLIKNTHIENFISSVASLTGGSGAAAVLVSDGSIGEVAGHRLVGGVNRSSAQFHNLCRWGMRKIQDSLFEQFMVTDANSVLKNGLNLGINTWHCMMQELNWCKTTVKKIITHQIGKAHRSSFLQALGYEEDMDFPTFPYLGNIGTVSLPISTAIAMERAVFKSGDRVGLLGIGSGLNCMMLGVEW
ncbi:MAG: 3-oxoacyl-ACP synthase III [Bdellovibrionota bacterium]